VFKLLIEVSTKKVERDLTMKKTHSAYSLKIFKIVKSFFQHNFGSYLGVFWFMNQEGPAKKLRVSHMSNTSSQQKQQKAFYLLKFCTIFWKLEYVNFQTKAINKVRNILSY